MSDDHIGVKINGIIYVKLDDVKPMRDRIEKLESALIDILKVPRSEASWGIALVIARKALEGKNETIG